jgi:replicative superfamily II helicase
MNENPLDALINKTDSKTKKEMYDEVYFDELRSILNSFESEMKDLRRKEKQLTELKDAAEEIVMEYGHYNRVTHSTVVQLDSVLHDIGERE